jgi:hypothetical protein
MHENAEENNENKQTNKQMSLRVFDITFITWRESLFMAE